MRVSTTARRFVGAISAAALLTSLVAGSAAATTEPDRTTITTPMYVVGYDAEVAAANGFEIITRPDGSQASIPVTAAAKRSEAAANLVSPLGTVVANCGSSSVELLDAGGGKAAVGTGFKLNRGAISYSWSVTVASFSDTYTKSFSGGLLSRHEWTGSFSWTVPKSNTYTAGVTSGSHAILNNGAVCYSGMPTSTYYIFR